MEALQRCQIALDPQEIENLQNVRNLLLDTDPNMSPDKPLTAMITRLWASFLDDTWVWGGKDTATLLGRHVLKPSMTIANHFLVTPRMAWVLRHLATFYESQESRDL